MMKKLSPTLKNIVKLLNDGHYHSGEALGEHLMISRNAVWKNMKQLTELGVELETIPSKGYCMKHPLILLDSKQISQYIEPHPTLKINQWDIFGSIDSTSDYFRSQAPRDGLHVCLAEHQTAGRGRFGRAWHSPFGANIYLSCRWPLNQDASNLGGLSLVISLAIVAALSEYGISGLSIKWPNDILWQGKKLAGVLVELQAESHGLTQIIIGIGINVNMKRLPTPEINQAWVSLDSIVDRPLSKLAAESQKQGAPERRTGAYTSVCEDSST
ncbi:MAG: biotin--[acetyl-CoA-carboxylase] ligase, partial [Legionellales bacterium]|nr:biotin--[acetyl-CoA-carboxylase] ligase [Legionellales bacterium]